MSYFLYRLKWMNLRFSPQPVMEPQTPLTHLHKPLQLAPSRWAMLLHHSGRWEALSL